MSALSRIKCLLGNPRGFPNILNQPSATGLIIFAPGRTYVYVCKRTFERFILIPEDSWQVAQCVPSRSLVWIYLAGLLAR